METFGKGEIMEPVIFATNVFVIITGGTHQGLTGIADEINENLWYQDININGENYQISNEFIELVN